MNGPTNAERILDAFLAPENDRLPDRVIDAALADIARTPQRRALRASWRFPNMPALSRATGLAAVALVAVVGAGGFIYLNSETPGGPGGPTTPTATTQAPTAAPSPGASEMAPGIRAWIPYTSEFYGYQMSYPSHWSVHSMATRAWQETDGRASADSWPYADVFENSEQVDGDSIGLWVWEMPAGEGVDIESVEGLQAWAQAFCEMTPAVRDVGASACEGYGDGAIPMCLDAGGDSCRGAILVPDVGGATAFFMDWPSVMLTGSPDMVRVAQIGRPDDFPAAARYGGSAELLKSILTTMDVWTVGQQPPEN